RSSGTNPIASLMAIIHRLSSALNVSIARTSGCSRTRSSRLASLIHRVGRCDEGVALVREAVLLDTGEGLGVRDEVTVGRLRGRDDRPHSVCEPGAVAFPDPVGIPAS